MFKTVAFSRKTNMRGGVILLGGFDGLHVGHRSLLTCAKEFGLPIGVMTIVGGKEGSLFTLEERELVFQKAGIDFAFELPFDEIKGLSPESFVQLLETQFEPSVFVCGEDFRFGHLAAGNPKTLEKLARARVVTLPLMVVDKQKVSATTVKNLIASGEVERANALLGEEFFLYATVVQGRKVGRTMGFPTANMEYPSEKFALPLGVYETRVCVDGIVHKSITNFGAKPTFLDGQVCVETYIDGFSGDLYGKKLAVRFVRKIRDVCRFESVEELRMQLQKDLRTIQ